MSGSLARPVLPSARASIASWLILTRPSSGQRKHMPGDLRIARPSLLELCVDRNGSEPAGDTHCRAVLAAIADTWAQPVIASLLKETYSPAIYTSDKSSPRGGCGD